MTPEQEKKEEEWGKEFIELDSIKHYFERKAFYLQACRVRQEEIENLRKIIKEKNEI